MMLLKKPDWFAQRKKKKIFTYKDVRTHPFRTYNIFCVQRENREQRKNQGSKKALVSFSLLLCSSWWNPDMLATSSSSFSFFSPVKSPRFFLFFFFPTSSLSTSTSLPSSRMSPPPPAPSSSSSSSSSFCVLLTGFILLLFLDQPVKGLIPEFLSYKTCVDAPPSFSGCMSNVTADIGQRVVLNCQVRSSERKDSHSLARNLKRYFCSILTRRRMPDQVYYETRIETTAWLFFRRSCLKSLWSNIQRQFFNTSINYKMS